MGVGDIRGGVRRKSRTHKGGNGACKEGAGNIRGEGAGNIRGEGACKGDGVGDIREG